MPGPILQLCCISKVVVHRDSLLPHLQMREVRLVWSNLPKVTGHWGAKLGADGPSSVFCVVYSDLSPRSFSPSRHALSCPSSHCTRLVSSTSIHSASVAIVWAPLTSFNHGPRALNVCLIHLRIWHCGFLTSFFLKF